MRCRKTQRMISARYDGELDEAGIKAVREHLSGCAECRDFAADLERSAGDLDLLTVPEHRWGFTERLMARLPEERETVGLLERLLGSLRPAAMGLGVAAFCLGAVLTALVSQEAQNGVAAVEQDTDAVAGDYFTTLAEVSVDEQLLALLSETEE